MICKKSYVDWVVNTLKETPEYSQIKNKLIFVDGMEYKDNVFTSNADFHASDLTLSETINNFSDYEDYENSYMNYSHVILIKALMHVQNLFVLCN